MCFDSWAVILSNCDFVLNVELYTNELKNQIEYERWVAGARAQAHSHNSCKYRQFYLPFGMKHINWT